MGYNKQQQDGGAAPNRGDDLIKRDEAATNARRAKAKARKNLAQTAEQPLPTITTPTVQIKAVQVLMKYDASSFVASWASKAPEIRRLCGLERRVANAVIEMYPLMETRTGTHRGHLNLAVNHVKRQLGELLVKYPQATKQGIRTAQGVLDAYAQGAEVIRKRDLELARYSHQKAELILADLASAS